MKALFDTNILIDYLRGSTPAETELSRYEARSISIVTWMEVLVGAPPELEAETRVFLDGFGLVELDRPVARKAIEVRRRYRLKLPDAIVWASAQVFGMLLVTRDMKDIPKDDPGIRIPY